MQKKPTTKLGRCCIQAVDRHMNTLRRHKQHRTKNSLRDVILGGQDGLVNMLGIAFGVVAAGGSNSVLGSYPGSNENFVLVTRMFSPEAILSLIALIRRLRVFTTV